jgi:excisionase family DNA binding protein
MNKTVEAPAPLLWRVRDLAAAMSTSERGIWKLLSAGRLPDGAVVRVGRSVRIRRESVETWIRAGCPAPTAKGKVRHAG